MVSLSDPEAKPRRDGHLERRGTWGEVTVGSLIAGPNRTDVYEVVAEAHGLQTTDGWTLWFRIANVNTGETWSVEPKPKSIPVTFLMPDDEAAPPPRGYVEDGDAIRLLFETLGAQIIATRDETTGMVWCPNYAAGQSTTHGSNDYGVEELEHLRIMHGVDVSALAELKGNEAIVERTKIHGRLHSPAGRNDPQGGISHHHEAPPA